MAFYNRRASGFSSAAVPCCQCALSCRRAGAKLSHSSMMKLLLWKLQEPLYCCFAVSLFLLLEIRYQALDNSTAEQVQDIILDPPENPYDTMKASLIRAFCKTQAEKDQALLSLNGLGGRKPSELLQHMQNWNADPATLFKALFLAQLPPNVQRILSTLSKTEIADLALEADRITEVTRLTQDMQVNATGTSQIPL